MKTCYKCKLEKPLKDFNKLSRSKDGYQPLCRDCDNKQTKERYYKKPDYYKNYAKQYKRKTINFLNKVKSNPCADCGKRYHPVCMDFDHMGEKRFNISQVKHLSIKSISKEIKKCELVCSNCHRLRTFKRRNA